MLIVEVNVSYKVVLLILMSIFAAW